LHETATRMLPLWVLNAGAVFASGEIVDDEWCWRHDAGRCGWRQ
jgi:hypothetical protein